MKTQLEIVPEWREALAAAGLTGFDAFMRVGGGEPVSHHRYRETIPLEVARDGISRKCFLKRVFWVPPKHAIWPLARGRRNSSQPWREWHVIAELQAAGISTMNRIAMGERRAWGRPIEAFILVEGVPERHTLAEWVIPGYPRPAGADQIDLVSLFGALGRCIGRLHAAGFYWLDIHGKHIFASPPSESETSEWSIRLIDLERITRASHGAVGVDPEERHLNLAMLWESLEPLQLSAACEEAFHRAYVDMTPEPARQQLEEWIEAPAETRRTSIRLPDDFVHPDRVRLHGADGVWTDVRVSSGLRRHRLEDLPSVFAFENGTSMGKPGLDRHRERIRIELDELGTDGVAYLKRYLRPPGRQQIRRIWETRSKRSTAWREVHFIKALGRMGISTMRCLAWGEEMRGRWERRSFILTEGIRGESLERLAARTNPPVDGGVLRLKRDVIEQLAVITATLHGNSLFHRDLYLAHVFLTRNRDGAVVLRLIDLARMVRQAPLKRRRVKDLSALDYSAPAPLVTRADRLRFLKRYVRSYDVAAPRAAQRAQLRELAEAVRRRTAWVARHDAKRRRRLNLETTP